MKNTNVAEKRDVWSYILIFFLAVSVIVVGFFSYRASLRNALADNTMEFMRELSNHDLMSLNNKMDASWSSLESIGKKLRISKIEDINDIHYLLMLESQISSYDKVYLVDDEGMVYSSNYQIAPIDDYPFKEKLIEKDGRFAFSYAADGRKEENEFLAYGIYFNAPITWKDKTFIGIVGQKSIKEVQKSLSANTLDCRGDAIIFSGNGLSISKLHSDRANNLPIDSNALLKDAIFKDADGYEDCIKKLENYEKFCTRFSYNGTGYYVYNQPIENTDWYLSVSMKTEVVDGQVNNFLLSSSVFFIVIAISILILAVFIMWQRQKMQIATASERAKTSFLSTMSHEIRTPLNGIIGLQYLMRQNMYDEEKMLEYMNKLEVSTEFLRSLVADILDMSKIASGRLDVSNEIVSLETILNEVEALLNIQADNAKLSFSMNSTLIVSSVYGDSMRLKQILVNFLSNAVKFTGHGGLVELAVTQKIINDDKVETTFMIYDNGCGMSKEFLTKIWEPFSQEGRVKANSGTGLGTTLSKTLAETMGGFITVESEEGVGSIFTIVIPHKINKESVIEEVTEKLAEVETDKKRILLVEDNDINREIVSDILRSEGCVVTEAVNGLDALKAFKNSPEWSFDFILMDVQMPIMNGYVAVEQIRQLDREDAQKIIIFALTANAFQEENNKALASGMNGVITKPLEVSKLLQLIGGIEK